MQNVRNNSNFLRLSNSVNIKDGQLITYELYHIVKNVYKAGKWCIKIQSMLNHTELIL